MKIPNVPGEFAFRALVAFEYHVSLKATNDPLVCLSNTAIHWSLTTNFYFTGEEAQQAYPDNQVKWPVEVYEDGSVRVVSEEELNEAKQ